MKSFEQRVLLDRTVILTLLMIHQWKRIITPYGSYNWEYLAFEKDMHVLVILTDMTNYAEG